MKTHTSTFNRLIKQLQFKVDFTVDCEIEDLDGIEILEPSCNMEFVNRLIGFTADGKVITMQFDNDYDSIMINDFRDIISSDDKMKVIEALEKALPTEKRKAVLVNNFKAFLANEIDKVELIDNISKSFPLVKEGKKSYWWRFFRNDTGANDILTLESCIGSSTNDKYIRGCMELAVEAPEEIQIYFS